MNQRKTGIIRALGPGILVAATGVGAGDLATATFTGTKLGTAILWAVVVGAVLKYVLNEGLTRWQLATETTLLEGCVNHLGRPLQWFFAVYLVVWSYLVAMALMSACGVAVHAMLPIFDDGTTGKIVFGIAQSLIAVLLVRAGGYALFERVMGLCIGVMFLVVVVTAMAVHPPWASVLSGLLLPRIPDFRGEGLQWTLALLGGVGGTLTILCYGYWIREEGRTGREDLKLCRIDLAAGYAMTAVFGLSMVIIGSQLGEVSGKGAALIVNTADTLEQAFGRFGVLTRWAFLIGAWGAFFSSLLGVWQSIPYLFADFWTMFRSHGTVQPGTRVDTRAWPYRAYLLGIATIPISGLFLFDFRSAVRVYAVVGALCIPMLVVVLLLLNGNRRLIGGEFCNSRLTNGLLIVTLLVSLLAGGFAIQSIATS